MKSCMACKTSAGTCAKTMDTFVTQGELMRLFEGDIKTYILKFNI